MGLDKKIKAKVLSADIPESECRNYAWFAAKREKSLERSLRNFKETENQLIHCVDFGLGGLRRQSLYDNLPFRDERYDSASTVATSGSAIIIAKLLEQLYRCDITVSIKELAELAVEKGYREYRCVADGKYISKGCKNVFWERFIPSLYGLESNRALSVESMLRSLEDYKFPVLLLSDKADEGKRVEKIKAINETEPRFVLMTGYTPNGIRYFEPSLCTTVYEEYSKILPFICAAWIIGLKY